MDKHHLIVAVKDLAVELGRTPTRNEFVLKMGISRHFIDKFFGSYAVLVQAAELDGPIPVRLTNKIFEADIEKHLENYEPRKPIERKPYPSLAVISDIHWPFENSRVVNRFIEYVGDVKPAFVIINGDAWDMYSHAKFPKSHNIFTPEQEEKLSRERNVQFWIEIQKRSPKSECIQMLGNHDVRMLKRTMEVQPQIEHWMKKIMAELFRFDGVKTVLDPRQELMLGEDIAVFHGYRTKLGDHRDFTLYNCINGHTHRGGVVFRQLRGRVLWELNSGLAGDPEGKGLTYTPQKIIEWTPGFGSLDTLGPRFISV